MALAAAGAGIRSNAFRSSLPRFLTFHSPSLRISSLPRRLPACKYHIRGMREEATLDPKLSSKDDNLLSQNWKIKMLYDGECPLCMREVNMLKERNKLYGAIKFVDISSKDYSPEENQGLEYETVMGRIHAILSDGTVVKDVDAFRRLYEEIGLGWVYTITKYEPIATIANAIYGVWAKYRLPITGRPPLEDILEARKKNMLEERQCTEDDGTDWLLAYFPDTNPLADGR